MLELVILRMILNYNIIILLIVNILTRAETLKHSNSSVGHFRQCLVKPALVFKHKECTMAFIDWNMNFSQYHQIVTCY